MRATGTPHTHPHTHTHVTSKVLIVWRLKVKTRVPSKGWREKRQERESWARAAEHLSTCRPVALGREVPLLLPPRWTVRGSVNFAALALKSVCL